MHKSKKVINKKIKEKAKEIKKNNSVKNNIINVTLYRSSGVVETIELEKYIIGVVAGEMPASFNIEALKAQAVVARTYALKAIKTGKKITDTVQTQRYIDINEMKKKWGSEYSKYYAKILQLKDKFGSMIL